MVGVSLSSLSVPYYLVHSLALTHCTSSKPVPLQNASTPIYSSESSPPTRYTNQCDPHLTLFPVCYSSSNFMHYSSC